MYRKGVMLMSTKQDEGVIKKFKFPKPIAEEHEQWIEVGYFTNHEDIAPNAFGLLRTAMSELKNTEKTVINFNEIVVDVKVELPEALSHRTIN